MKKVNIFILFSLLAGVFCVGAFFLTLHFIQPDTILTSKQMPIEKEVQQQKEPEKPPRTREDLENEILEKAIFIRKNEYLVLEAPISIPFSNPEYRVYYYLKDTDNQEKIGSLSIILYANPFEALQKKAEENLLTFLDMTKKEACQLDITLGVPFSVDSINAGKNFSLSFCE
ncbi:MAG: hypothetical protein EOM19_08060 [Candidatus Moranbacteria bacterium]|nr:hypothetical protein [Candidatus Moranbacteria bacterium]